jgi:hypothetical protein
LGESGEGGVEGGFVEVLQGWDFVGHLLSRVNERVQVDPGLKPAMEKLLDFLLAIFYI